MDSIDRSSSQDDSRTILIQIITWVFLGCAVLFTIFRGFTKWRVAGRFGVDDLCVLLSLLFLGGQSADVTIATLNGLGRPMALMSDNELRIVLQNQYAAIMLYTASLLFSKLPTLILLHNLCAAKSLRRLFLLTGLVIIGWAVSSIVVHGLQCLPPASWDYLNGRCLNRRIYLTSFEAINGFTDALLIFLPLVVWWKDGEPFNRKTSALLVFGVRYLPMAAIVTKIVLQYPNFRAADPLYVSWPSIICTQIIQLLSLMSACILYLRPFHESLATGIDQEGKTTGNTSRTTKSRRSELSTVGGRGRLPVQEVQEPQELQTHSNLLVVNGSHLPRVSTIYSSNPLGETEGVQSYIVNEDRRSDDEQPQQPPQPVNNLPLDQQPHAI